MDSPIATRTWPTWALIVACTVSGIRSSSEARGPGAEQVLAHAIGAAEVVVAQGAEDEAAGVDRIDHVVDAVHPGDVVRGRLARHLLQPLLVQLRLLLLLDAVHDG